MTSIYILTTDRPTTDLACWKISNAVSRQWAISTTSYLVLGMVSGVGGSYSATSGWPKSKMVAGHHLGKFLMAISLQQVIRFTSCLVLGRGFRSWRIEWLYFRLVQIMMAAGRHLGKFRMAIFLQGVIRYTSSLVLR